MSELNRGDRVKVEFEAVVDDVTADGTRVYIESDGGSHLVAVSALTKLHDPLPTKPNAVIVINGSARPVGRLRRSGQWQWTGQKYSSSSSVAQEAADVHGFTVLYAGDDE